MPKQIKWSGHPFYLYGLQTLNSLTRELPESVHELLSVPLWYNRFFKTSFDCELSRKGFNYVRDIVSGGEIANLKTREINRLPKRKKNVLTRIKESFPEAQKNVILSYPDLETVVFPELLVSRGESLVRISRTDSRMIYDCLISDKARLPVGILRWKNKYFLSEARIKFAFSFARNCVKSTKLWNFQFKICTYTLPTEEYLWNYKVRNNYYCKKCLQNNLVERDNILHSLLLCPQIAPFVSKVFTFLTNNCKAADSISELEYILGFVDKDKEGLNCALLELKRFVFYNFDEPKNHESQFNIFKSRLRRTILLDKKFYCSKNNHDFFYKKWELFCPIYMIHGPDPLW